MNNADFRKFVAETPRRQNDGSPEATRRPNRASTSLGSKARSAIPMTPRSVKANQQVNFARQLAEQHSGAQQQKKPRSSGLKGSKLGQGYVDRAQARREAEQNDEEEEQDQNQERIRDLEAKLRLGELDDEGIEELRAAVNRNKPKVKHAVRGLDMRLVRSKDQPTPEIKADHKDEEKEPGEDEKDLDDDKAFTELEQQEIKPVIRHEGAKKTAFPPPPKPVAGAKRTRNDILAELRASRQVADGGRQAQATPGFRKVSMKSDSGPKIEIDEKGREVLITVDENGRVKRKVRKVARKPDSRDEGAIKPTTASLGSGTEVSTAAPNEDHVAAPASPPQDKEDGDEDDEDDIFADVGDDYDPLKDLRADEDSDADSSAASEDGGLDSPNEKPEAGTLTTAEADAAAMPPPPKPHVKRNYFATTGSATEDGSTEDTDRKTPFSDPALLAALKRASKIKLASEADEERSKAKTPSTAAERLLGPQHDRDFEDLDMGFGSSRGGDDLDVEEDSGRVKLSKWRGLDGDEDEDEGGSGKGGGGKKRQRSRKKRKGDKDSAADVLGVIAGRK